MASMLPRFIDSWETLPRATSSLVQERLWFDLKETYAPKSQIEMAKDVAALANAIGGALIIGAREGPTEPDYSSPLSVTYAAQMEREFDEAVRDFCRPSPTVHARGIPAPSESQKVVLVVNVEAFADQPVAARHATDKDAWRFPYRVGRHTEFLLPEQLPLYMNSRARRHKLLLLRVLEDGGQIDLFHVPGGTYIQAPLQFRVESVDEGGSAAFVIRDVAGDFDGKSATIPIDDIEAVWLQHTARWAVRVSGRLESFVEAAMEYLPPATFVVASVAKAVADLAKHVREIDKTLSGTLSVEHHARVEPRETDIADRAYALWQQRLRRNAPGTAEDDWLRAKRLLLA